jgi:hypothetical protein
MIGFSIVKAWRGSVYIFHGDLVKSTGAGSWQLFEMRTGACWKRDAQSWIRLDLIVRNTAELSSQDLRQGLESLGREYSFRKHTGSPADCRSSKRSYS